MSFIKLWVTLFTDIPTVFFVIGVCLIWSQTQKIDTYLPTHAEVRVAHIDKRVNRSSEERLRDRFVMTKLIPASGPCCWQTAPQGPMITGLRPFGAV